MRYILSKKKGITTFGYKVMSQGQKVFIDAQEVDLAQHVKEQANKFCDASAAPCRLLAFQFAEKNNVSIPAPKTLGGTCRAKKMFVFDTFDFSNCN